MTGADEIMGMFSVHGPLTPPMLADILDCSESHAGTMLRELHTQGLLKRRAFHSGRRGRPAWEYEPA
jgi:predicted transcriptional regulator